MSETRLMARLPLGPHPDTLRNPAYTILDGSGTRLLCWCPRHRCGAIYHIEALVWSLEVPITFAEFLRGLRARNVLPVQNDEDLSRWIEACTQGEQIQPTAPGGRC